MKNDDYIMIYNEINLIKMKWLRWGEPILLLKSHSDLN